MIRRVVLDGEVRPGRRVAPEDLGQVRSTLSRLGLFDPARDPENSESLMGPGLQRAIKVFQSGQGLREDATLRPRGPTEARLNLMLKEGRGLRAAERGGAIGGDARVSADRVGPGLENHPDDVLAIGTALRRLGHIKPGAPTPAKTGAVFDGLKSFQRASGLKRDGVMAPGGPTEQQIVRGLGGGLSGLQTLRRRLSPRPIPGADAAEADRPSGPAPFQTASPGAAGITRVADSGIADGQAADDTLFGPDASERLFVPGVGTQGPDTRNEIEPVMSPQSVFDGITSDPPTSPDPFPVDRFRMLDRPIGKIAELAGIRLDHVREAGPLAEQALRGVASSIGHNEAERKKLDALLDRLEDAGHRDLVERMRFQRKEMGKVDEHPRFFWLLPDDKLRELTGRKLLAAVMNEKAPPPVGGAFGIDGLFARALGKFEAELDRRDDAATARRIRDLEEEVRRLKQLRRQ